MIIKEIGLMRGEPLIKLQLTVNEIIINNNRLLTGYNNNIKDF